MPKRIPLTQGQFAIVDDEDYEELNKFNWHALYNKKTRTYTANRNDYRADRRIYLSMHRQIMNTPKEMETDHINHNTLDNRRSNLRICTTSQNQMNARTKSNNTSGTSGVSFDKSRNKFIVQIRFNSKRKTIGRFLKIEDATKARKQAENKYFGEFAYNGS